MYRLILVRVLTPTRSSIIVTALPTPRSAQRNRQIITITSEAFLFHNSLHSTVTSTHSSAGMSWSTDGRRGISGLQRRGLSLPTLVMLVSHAQALFRSTSISHPDHDLHSLPGFSLARLSKTMCISPPVATRPRCNLQVQPSCGTEKAQTEHGEIRGPPDTDHGSWASSQQSSCETWPSTSRNTHGRPPDMTQLYRIMGESILQAR